jgi:hypothetical protein
MHSEDQPGEFSTLELQLNVHIRNKRLRRCKPTQRKLSAFVTGACVSCLMVRVDVGALL